MSSPEVICKNPDYFSPSTGLLHFTDDYVQARTLFLTATFKTLQPQANSLLGSLAEPWGKGNGTGCSFVSCGLAAMPRHRHCEPSARSQGSINACSSGDRKYRLTVLLMSFFTAGLAHHMVLEWSTIKGRLTESGENENHSSLKSRSCSRPRRGYSPDTSLLPPPHHASRLFSFT